MHNLAINYLTEDGYPTVLFEPSELIDFKVSWDWQRKWQDKLVENPLGTQAVWILQHQKCYTLGRGANENNLLFKKEKSPCDLYRIDRGGEVTHHLPGQLVVYLVIDLHRYKTDLNWYLRQLENVLIEVLDELGLKGYRVPGITGVWCNGEKVGSIGVGCRRWVTQHGMALNVNCELSGFNEIVPCGLHGQTTGRISKWLPNVQINDVRSQMNKSLKKHFELLWTHEKSLVINKNYFDEKDD